MACNCFKRFFLICLLCMSQAIACSLVLMCSILLSHLRKLRDDFVYLIALRHGVAELRAVGVDIREESFDILLRVTAVG